MKQALMCLNKKPHHYLNAPKFSIAEHLLSLQELPVGTCHDMYHLEDNVVFCAILGHVNPNDIVVTFVGCDADTMVDHVCDQDNISFKLHISSGVIYGTSTLNNQEGTKETDEADIDALITDVKKFFLSVKLQISSGMIYHTSPLKDGTSADKDDGYEIEMLEIVNNKQKKVATSQSNWKLKSTKLNQKLNSNKSKFNDKSNLTLKSKYDHYTPMLDCVMEANSITSDILSNIDLLCIQNYNFDLIFSSSFSYSSTLDPSSSLFDLFHPLDYFS